MTFQKDTVSSNKSIFLQSNSGTIIQELSNPNIDFILINHQKQQQLSLLENDLRILYEQTDKRTIILNSDWLDHCIRWNLLLGEDSNWMGCRILGTPSLPLFNPDPVQDKPPQKVTKIDNTSNATETINLDNNQDPLNPTNIPLIDTSTPNLQTGIEHELSSCSLSPSTSKPTNEVKTPTTPSASHQPQPQPQPQADDIQHLSRYIKSNKENDRNTELLETLSHTQEILRCFGVLLHGQAIKSSSSSPPSPPPPPPTGSLQELRIIDEKADHDKLSSQEITSSLTSIGGVSLEVDVYPNHVDEINADSQTKKDQVDIGEGEGSMPVEILDDTFSDFGSIFDSDWECEVDKDINVDVDKVMDIDETPVVQQDIPVQNMERLFYNTTTDQPLRLYTYGLTQSLIQQIKKHGGISMKDTQKSDIILFPRKSKYINRTPRSAEEHLLLNQAFERSQEVLSSMWISGSISAKRLLPKDWYSIQLEGDLSMLSAQREAAVQADRKRHESDEKAIQQGRKMKRDRIRQDIRLTSKRLQDSKGNMQAEDILKSMEVEYIEKYGSRDQAERYQDEKLDNQKTEADMDLEHDGGAHTSRKLTKKRGPGEDLKISLEDMNEGQAKSRWVGGQPVVLALGPEIPSDEEWELTF
ncbi:uncharacterized protein L201_006957 [Kwoniella dendrophila CBS 6074]|uniref:BRCT domain-containing protein n=1 Tax=Kwoniella dendrophila CBS 6074 TaxID=1295534 RepID=A0AAX4K497_9TREE